MAGNAPGRSTRNGLTLMEVSSLFSTDEAARAWITAQRWPMGAVCPFCGTSNVQCGIKHKTMTHRCRECQGKPMFSLKTGTVMEGSKLKYRPWAIAIYLFTTNIKGVSSLKLHRELGIGQKAAWFMLHRLRKAYELEVGPFRGPIEVDETYLGGKRRNMPRSKRKELDGRGPAGKVAVVGAKDRLTRMVSAEVVESTDKDTLQGFVQENAEAGAAIYTDEHGAYEGLPNHETVKHSVGEYARNQVHTNGVESFWSLLKRGYHGIYHKISPKHMRRYVAEFAGRHNLRDLDTIDQMGTLVLNMENKRLRYKDLIARNGLSSGAR